MKIDKTRIIFLAWRAWKEEKNNILYTFFFFVYFINMGFEKLLKNHYVKLALLAVVAYLVYSLFVVREGLKHKPLEPKEVHHVAHQKKEGKKKEAVYRVIPAVCLFQRFFLRVPGVLSCNN